MAVQQNKKSPMKSKLRRSGQKKYQAPALAVNPLNGQTHLRHHISADGTYRGKQYLIKAAFDTEETSSES